MVKEEEVMLVDSGCLSFFSISLMAVRMCTNYIR